MKILKPGKVKKLKCVCPNCGCEFLYEYFGNMFFTESSRVICPQEGCKNEVFLRSGTPYEEQSESM